MRKDFIEGKPRTWAYRVGRRSNPPNIEFFIIELHRDETGRPYGYVEKPQPYGDTSTELRRDLKYMIDAFLHPEVDLNWLDAWFKTNPPKIKLKKGK